jgi:dolichol-phosphate mannosyltransferase
MTTKTESFSIIIPTFREAKNISILINRIAAIPFQQSFEVIIVDDFSQDGIDMVVAKLQREFHWLHLIVRNDKKSLSASALAGFNKAQYPLLILMDADLSHPPEKIPEMLAALISPEVDFVIGSRYVTGGSTDTVWPMPRRITSRLSAWLAQFLLPMPVKDPLSGFFAFRKSSLDNAKSLNLWGGKLD